MDSALLQACDVNLWVANLQASEVLKRVCTRTGVETPIQYEMYGRP